MLSLILLLVSSVFISGETGQPHGQNGLSANSVLVSSTEIQEPPAGTFPGDSWLPGWTRRVKFSIDPKKIDAPLYNFPVLLHISRSSGIDSADLGFVFAELAFDGDRHKIAITTADGTTQCFAEIEKWDTAGREAWIWFKAPYIHSGTSTVFYLYYDRNRDSNFRMIGSPISIPAANVWDTDYKMVLHLAENGDGSPGEYTDSTGNGNHGTGGNGSSLMTPVRVSARAGDGQMFDRHYIEVPDCDDFSVSTNGGMTVSFWLSPGVLNFNSEDVYTHYLGKGDAGQQEWVFRIYDRDGTDRPQRLSFYLFNLEGGLGAGSFSEQPLETGEWVYVTGKADRKNTYIYRDGLLAGQTGYTVPRGDIPAIEPRNGTNPLRIGTRELKDWFIGRMDEIRLSSVPRSSAWIKASYYSESDNLLSFDDPVTLDIIPETAAAPDGSPSVPSPADTGDKDKPGFLEGSNLIYFIIGLLVLIALAIIFLLRRRNLRNH
jgi:hypothetical protein